MISKSLSIFFWSLCSISYYHHFLLPFKVKLLEKDIYVYYLPFFCSNAFLIYSNLSPLFPWVSKTTLSQNPKDTILCLILLSLSAASNTVLFWNNLTSHLLCHYSLLIFLLPLWLLLFSVHYKLSLLNHSSLSYQMPSFLYTRSWQQRPTS